MKPKFYRQLLAVCVASLMSAFSYGQDSTEVTEVLPTIEVQAVEAEQPKTNVEQKTAKTIQQEMIRDTRDLVRYSPDVGISDSGRKQKGFAMRGVEGNRVGISIDGVAIPDFEENSLYTRYGNFNNSRVSLDSEFSRKIDIVKGADSFNIGSGSLGGGVNYQTLMPEDLVQNGNWGGLYRIGYASKNNEWVNTLGLAYVGSEIDALLMYSHRHGHELESAGGKIEPWAGYNAESRQQNAQIGADRINPDPEKHRNNSYLAKLFWKINPNHRVGFSFNAQDNDSYANELSYSLTSYWRNNNDLQKLINSSIFYEWTPEQSNLIDKMKWSVDYQKTDNTSLTYQGDRHWSSKEPEPLNVYKDRRLTNQLYRVMWDTVFQPVSLLGLEHELSLKTFATQRKFENVNIDTYYNKYKDYAVERVDEYTLQHPIQARQYGISLQDKFRINDVFSGYAGLRYDYERVKPQDLNLKCGAYVSFGLTCQNVDMKGHSFKNWSAQLGLDAQLNDTWKIGYLLGTGYRNPTASELYFTFESVFGNWASNPNLKSEKSLNQSIFVQGKGQYGDLNLNLYHTRYKDFLFEEETVLYRPNRYYTPPPYCYGGDSCKEKLPEYFQRMENFDSAKISGLEFTGVLDFASLAEPLEGFKLSTALGYSRGKLSGKHEASLVSIQPLKAVLGLDYESPNGKWGVFSRATYSAEKKAKDAEYIGAYTKCHEWGTAFYGDYCKRETSETEVKSYEWLNKSSTVFDLFGYYNLNDNLTFRAGVYNLGNKKYLTWDALRGISNNGNGTGTTNAVGKRYAQGLERFYAPERNYSMSIEYKF